MTQIGFVVNDIEKTSQAFADFLGVEKPQWSLTDTIDKTHGEFTASPALRAPSSPSSTWARPWT